MYNYNSNYIMINIANNNWYEKSIYSDLVLVIIVFIIFLDRGLASAIHLIIYIFSKQVR